MNKLFNSTSCFSFPFLSIQTRLGYIKIIFSRVYPYSHGNVNSICMTNDIVRQSGAGQAWNFPCFNESTDPVLPRPILLLFLRMLIYTRNLGAWLGVEFTVFQRIHGSRSSSPSIINIFTHAYTLMKLGSLVGCGFFRVFLYIHGSRSSLHLIIIIQACYYMYTFGNSAFRVFSTEFRSAVLSRMLVIY